MADVRHIGLDEVVRQFQDLEDPRCTVNRRHPLASVLVIALLAVPVSAGGSTASTDWADMKRGALLGALDLPMGVMRRGPTSRCRCPRACRGWGSGLT